MHTPIHQNDPGSEEIARIKGILAEKGLEEIFNPLLNAIKKNEEESDNLYRLFRLGDDEGGGGGGFGLPPKPKQDKAAIQEILLPPIDFYTTKLMLPRHPLMTTLQWGRRNKRFFLPILMDMELTEALGVIWVESNETTRNSRAEETRQIYVKLLPSVGNPKITKGNLLGFEVGFKRFDADRGYMFLDIYEYPEEATNAVGADMTWEIPVTGRKFLGTEKILTDNLINQYNGGAGMKLDMYITLKAKINV